MSFIFRRLFSTTSPTMSEATKAQAQVNVRKLIADNGVVVFSKTTCPYCRKTKSALDGYGAKYAVYELDEDIDNGKDLQDALAVITGQSTVPNIYINKQHIGGNSDFQAIIKNGKDGKNIEELLQEAGAI